MQLVGVTAAFDAVLSASSWLIVRARRRTLQAPSTLVEYFEKYFLTTTVFLVLTAVAMLWLAGTTQMLVVIVSDLVLWVSLAYFIGLVSVGRVAARRGSILVGFWLLAALGTIYQLAGLLGVQLSLGTVITYLLANMAPILMYAVWVPSAVVFLGAAARASDTFLRRRFVLFAIGLLFITFSWAWRLLSAEPSAVLVMAVSFIGFVTLLAGLVVRKT